MSKPLAFGPKQPRPLPFRSCAAGRGPRRCRSGSCRWPQPAWPPAQRNPRRRTGPAAPCRRRCAPADGLDIVLFTKESIFQSPEQPQTLYTKLLEHLLALSGVEHFRVELYGVQALSRRFRWQPQGSYSVCGDLEARGLPARCSHCGSSSRWWRAEHPRTSCCCCHKDLGLAVLTLRGAADMTAQQVHHQLAAVADSQHGMPQLKISGSMVGESSR